VPGRGEETSRVRELRSLEKPFDALVVLFLLIMLFSPDFVNSGFGFLDLNMIRAHLYSRVENIS